MSRNKELIIVIDMLNGFAKTGPLASDNINAIIPNIQKILENKKADNLFICDSHSTSDLEMKCYPEHCLTNTYEAKVVSELEKYVQNVILKNTTNGFFNLDKDKLLEYDVITLVGCCTDICVLQLGLSLITYLYMLKSKTKVVVYSDAVATYDSENHSATEFHEYALKLMHNAGIEVTEWKQ
ncbi:cysteine hydrolase family protein [Mycoplasma buteonis]|uniref:cysteine hydrolase family protein n=1 Tax=Mycoplasma buteonis TaxID=171280 RepID=UPI0005624FEE|nr:isochorismatase family cysteine hydrolase [Mycoplasma buteonis]